MALNCPLAASDARKNAHGISTSTPFGPMTIMRRLFVRASEPVRLRSSLKPVPPAAAIAGTSSSMPHRMACLSAATVSWLPNSSDATVELQKVGIAQGSRSLRLRHEFSGSLDLLSVRVARRELKPRDDLADHAEGCSDVSRRDPSC